MSMRESVTCKCPFCGGEFVAGMYVINGLPGVVHTLPPCEQFMSMEVEDFLDCAREASAGDGRN